MLRDPLVADRPKIQRGGPTEKDDNDRQNHHSRAHAEPQCWRQMHRVILAGGSTGLEPAASGVTGRPQRPHNPADPGKSGSAVPTRGRLMPIVDACFGTACKFLQAGHDWQRSAAMLEHENPAAPIRGSSPSFRGLEQACRRSLNGRMRCSPPMRYLLTRTWTVSWLPCARTLSVGVPE